MLDMDEAAGVPDGMYGLHRCEDGCGTWLYPHMFHMCSERGSITVDGWGRITTTGIANE